MLIYIVAGLTTGSIFGLAAVGVVLTYKTSGIFNFAHGALASASAFIFYFLNTQHSVPWPVAALVSIVICGPVLGLGLEIVARRLAPASLPMRVLGTVGILLTIEGLLELVYAPGPDREVGQFLPAGGFSIFGTPVGYYQVIIFAVGLVAVIGLTAFLRWSRSGLSMRAVVDNTELLDLAGTSPTRIRRYAWLIGSTAAAASGVLIAPLLPLDATSLTLLIVTAFGAAAIGGFTSLPLTYLGGLAIGIGQALLNKYIQNSTGLLGGLSSSLPFLLLFVLLIAAPRLRRPSSSARPPRTAARAWRVPPRLRTGGLGGLLVVLCLVPTFADIYITAWTELLAYTIVFLSLGLLVRVAGQVSLAQVSFMAIGVAAFSHLAVGHHWPWLLALVGAGVIAAPVGALLAIPAIRFPGLYLALATLGFGILLEQMFYGQSYMFGAFDAGLTVPTPDVPRLGLDGGDNGYYYLVLLITLAIAGLVVAISHTRLGRLLKAMGDSPTGLASCGTSINVSQVIVFALSAAIAAIGGALDGGVLGAVSGSNYQPLTSLQLFAVVMLTLGGVPWYAILAAAGTILIPQYISPSATVGYAFTLLFGVSAIIFTVTPDSGKELPERARNLIDRLFGTARPAPAVPPVADTETSGASGTAVPPLTEPVPPGAGLAVDGVTVQFGGLVAADDVTLYAAPGQITGLIGPNGAGKTTVFNACTGLARPSRGRVRLGGHAIKHAGVPSRARKGLGRTFQHLELFDSMSVRANVALGAEGRFAGRNPVGHLIATPRQLSLGRRRTADALELCGITAMADEAVGTLSTGQRRLVELARCLAGQFSVLLLDEPSSGLDAQETARFGEILRTVVDRRGVAILLIEHDMTLVNGICDQIYVLDSGKNLFQGTSAEVTASPLVRSAYLKSDQTHTAAARERVPGGSGGVAPVLALKAVDAGYGMTTVLRNVDLEVHAGQAVALLGPNGAGKTTLLRTASGILRPTAGQVALGRVDVSGLAPHRRSNLGLCLIPEGRGVFKSLSVLENLRLQLPAGQRPTEGALERAFEAFPILAARRHQLAGRMSGGQQQMLALARADLSDPKVIMLDELSMGLAPIVVDEMFAALEQLTRAGIAMLLVEQYVSRAIDLSERVILLNKGEVTYSGASSSLDEETLVGGYLGGQPPSDRPAAAGQPASEGLR